MFQFTSPWISEQWLTVSTFCASQGVRTPILQLSAMQEGDYTFQLTVTDSSGQQDTAQVTVIVQPGKQLELRVVPPENLLIVLWVKRWEESLVNQLLRVVFAAYFLTTVNLFLLFFFFKYSLTHGFYACLFSCVHSHLITTYTLPQAIYKYTHEVWSAIWATIHTYLYLASIKCEADAST